RKIDREPGILLRLIGRREPARRLGLAQEPGHYRWPGDLAGLARRRRAAIGRHEAAIDEDDRAIRQTQRRDDMEAGIAFERLRVEMNLAVVEEFACRAPDGIGARA